ncbi:nuclear transport factor 2 family protein [Streptomyces sp. NPDC096132]|uniref:nuclear transport factor 2 family protein n=1 Tax=Streptomyces sp. NPDC096132 TaxID=3366075 RepID=UPI0038305EB3
MTDHPNIAVLQWVMAALTAGDMEAPAEVFHPDVVWHNPGQSPLAGEYRGREAAFAAFQKEFQGGTYHPQLHDADRIDHLSWVWAETLAGATPLPAAPGPSCRWPVEGGTVHVTARTRDDLVVDCPGCGTAAHRVHSRYERHLADTGLAGRPVVIDLSVRRLVCDWPTCPRRTLTAHPGAEVIYRDRDSSYSRAATKACPDTVQVADRWHLLQSLSRRSSRSATSTEAA